LSKFIQMKERSIELLLEKLPQFGFRVVLAILIFVFGFWLSNRLKNIVRRRLVKRQVDPSIREFLIPIFDTLFKILVIITSISTVGIEITSFSAIMLGLAAGIGMSLQGSLANFAGGLLIIFFKPFKVGDYIEALDNGGTIESISILYTSIVTSNQQLVILPNASLLNNPVINYSVKPTRRLEIKIGISYDEDFKGAIELLKALLDNDHRILKNQPTSVEIDQLADERISLVIKGFTKSDDYWDTYYHFQRQILETLSANNIKLTPSPAQMIVTDKS